MKGGQIYQFYYVVSYKTLVPSSGATVYMLCRNKERGEAALNQIRSKTGNENVRLEV